VLRPYRKNGSEDPPLQLLLLGDAEGEGQRLRSKDLQGLRSEDLSYNIHVPMGILLHPIAEA
jgi:hypothetical protein